ncbi:hypothetical protein CEUSTIGMA_g5686.t1 [Chlamydomonas eustigma]|uniref:EF-hand domain-containing protein n=1 Tax=Chlamydomonas eustigma TaxID=1157962 RepID=A0A250X581_9CHLO|nr:hypothetical protein CEUSTIGMA_g5686.t1 [Chlamydomonas eustigma]|eukprot:GAX78244.1 hypothetical protein CEUSTIGMA_g5686.t1 [Chlamydomonas eustigma]
MRILSKLLCTLRTPELWLSSSAVDFTLRKPGTCVQFTRLPSAGAIDAFHMMFEYGNILIISRSLLNGAGFQNKKKKTIRQTMNLPNNLSDVYNRPSRGLQGFKVLGIHPRDLSLFLAAGSRVAMQRATLSVRDDKIFIKTEAVRAVVKADKAVVLKSDRESENQGVIGPMLQAVSSQPEDLPFELRAVEALLHATVMYFERRICHLSWMLEIVMDDMQEHDNLGPFAAMSNENILKQLVPLDKALVSVRTDAAETTSALQKVLSDDDLMAAMCLTALKENYGTADAARKAETRAAEPCRAGVAAQHGPQDNSVLTSTEENDARGSAVVKSDKLISSHETSESCAASPQLPDGSGGRSNKDAVMQVELMLQSYEREMSSVEGALREMEDNLDTTRDSWRMKLDSARNQMMLINIWLSMLSISLMLTTILPAYLGMNLKHGYEDVDGTFYLISALSAAGGVLSLPSLISFYKRGWKRHSDNELSKVNRMRIVLMQHLDDLDDIFAACSHMPSRVNRAEFSAHLTKHLPYLKLSEEIQEFLFQQFDINDDGEVQTSELMELAALELENTGRLPTRARVSSYVLRTAAVNHSSPATSGKF